MASVSVARCCHNEQSQGASSRERNAWGRKLTLQPEGGVVRCVIGSSMNAAVWSDSSRSRRSAAFCSTSAPAAPTSPGG